MSFIFGGDTPWTYEQMVQKRRVADALMAKQMGQAPRNVGEGLHAIGNALAIRGINKRADARDGELRAESEARFDDIMAALNGGSGRTGASQPSTPLGPNADIAEEAMEGVFGIDPDERLMLARTLQAEAGNQGKQGMLDVGSVIQNRADTGGYGDGIEGVIMKPGQFSPWNSVTGYADGEQGQDMNFTPTAESFGAADEVLSGHHEDATGGATHFYNPDISQPSWGSNSFVKRGDHVFGNADGAPGQAIPNQATVMQLAELASDPYLAPGQTMVVEALLGKMLNPLAPEKPTDDVREYNFAKNQGYEGTFVEFMTDMRRAGATNINNTNGGMRIPKNYMQDPNDPNGVVPIPGGPADTTAEDEAAQTNKERSGGVVTEDIGRALTIIEKSPNWTTGIGSWLKSIPGSEAKTLDSLLTTIKANVGFDRLQQMRDASKTGGALGAINKTEMDLLTSALGSLDQSLDDKDLAKNLSRINEIYLDIIHGKGNRPDTPPPDNLGSDDLPPAPEGMDPEMWPGIWADMPSEDRALFK
jgi:hypothetical protein